MTVAHDQAFLIAAQQCAQEMRENADFVMNELGKVTVPDHLRRQIEQWIQSMVATSDDMRVELADWQDLSSSNPLSSTRCARILRWARRELWPMHELVLALRSAADADRAVVGASLLVGESATNILLSFNRMVDVSV